MTMQNGSAPKRAHNNHSNKNGHSCPPAGPKNRITAHIDERDPAPEQVPFSFRIMPLAAWVTIRHPWCVQAGKPLWVGVDPETDSIVYATTDAYPLADEWDRLEPIPEGLVCDELCPAADDGPITVYIGTRLVIGILKTLERDRTDAQIRVESFLSSGGMKTSREGGAK